MAGKLRSIQRAQDQETAKTSVLQVTLADLLNSQGALQALSRQTLPARDAFKLSKIIRAVSQELETFNEVRVKLCEQHGGVFNKETNRYEFPNGKEAELNAEYIELIKAEVAIPGQALRITEFSNLIISAGDLLALAWLFED